MANFCLYSIGPPTLITSSRLARTKECFWRTRTFFHRKRYRLICRTPSFSQRWFQIGNIADGYPWHESINKCRSFWSIPMDSNHVLVRNRTYLRLVYGRIYTEAALTVQLILDHYHRFHFQSEFRTRSRRVKILRIRMNTGNKSRNCWTQRQLSRSIPCYVNIRSNGFP